MQALVALVPVQLLAAAAAEPLIATAGRCSSSRCCKCSWGASALKAAFESAQSSMAEESGSGGKAVQVPVEDLAAGKIPVL